MKTVNQPASGRGVLNRAMAASAALVVGAVAVTGVFVAKIARSYAAPGSTVSGGTGDQNSPFSDDGSFGDQGSQLGQPQLYQPPVGSSHGS